MTIWTIWRGESPSLFCHAFGDMGDVVSVGATVKRARSSDQMAFPPDQPVVYNLTPAVSADPQGWTIAMTEEQTRAMEPGLYGLQLRVVQTGDLPLYSPILFLRVIEPVFDGGA